MSCHHSEIINMIFKLSYTDTLIKVIVTLFCFLSTFCLTEISDKDVVEILSRFLQFLTRQGETDGFS